MLLIHFFARSVLILVAACALLGGASVGLGSILPRAEVIYFSTFNSDAPTSDANLFDPLHHLRLKLSTRQQIISSPVPSPDGQKFAFLYSSYNLRELRVFDYATGQITPIYSNTASEHANNSLTIYTWSPSGRYVSFSSGSRLFKYDFVRREVSPFVTDGGTESFNDTYPSWSADETRIAFVSARRETNTWQVYLADAEGSNLRRATRVDVCIFLKARWSPVHANLLAIEGRCEGDAAIQLLDADTGILRPLTDGVGASWSPDGSSLLFTGRSDQRIYTAAVDGTGWRRLTSGVSAVWLPDSRTILLSSASGDLYTIGVDGSNLQQLTTHNGDPFFYISAWSR